MLPIFVGEKVAVSLGLARAGGLVQCGRSEEAVHHRSRMPKGSSRASRSSREIAAPGARFPSQIEAPPGVSLAKFFRKWLFTMNVAIKLHATVQLPGEGTQEGAPLYNCTIVLRGLWRPRE